MVTSQKEKIAMIRAMQSLGEPKRAISTERPLSDSDGHQLYANGFQRAIEFALAILTDGEEGELPEATRQAIDQILKRGKQ